MSLLRVLIIFIISNCIAADEENLIEENACTGNGEIATANKCEHCICDYGHIICTRLSCKIDEVPEGCKLIIRGDECCPIVICEGVLPGVSTAVCKEGALVYSSNPCQSCVCRQKSIICEINKCEISELSPGCRYVALPGKCCPDIMCATPSTPEVLHSTSRACQPWETLPSSSPCEKCFCDNGVITCAELQCTEAKVPPGCQLIKVKDECCLVIRCSIKMSPQDAACVKRLPHDTPCRKCKCEAGQVQCTTAVCPRFRLAPNCRAVPAEGQCCASVQCKEVVKEEIGY